jgi:hypothetical protein
VSAVPIGTKAIGSLQSFYGLRISLGSTATRSHAHPTPHCTGIIALSVPHRQAIRHGKSRKGPWHMSKTIASGVGLTNAWLAAQGVLSMKTLWAELAHLRSTAVCGSARTVVWGGCPATGIFTRFCQFFVQREPKIVLPQVPSLHRWASRPFCRLDRG